MVLRFFTRISNGAERRYSPFLDELVHASCLGDTLHTIFNLIIYAPFSVYAHPIFTNSSSKTISILPVPSNDPPIGVSRTILSPDTSD
jgi:hypothetical protein